MLVILSATSCISTEKGVKGNKNLVTRAIQVDDFDEISLSSKIESVRGINPLNKKNFGVFNYTQTQNPPSLEITMDENLFDLLDIKSANRKLTIRTKENQKIYPSGIIINGSSKDLIKVEVSGCINFVAEEPLRLTKTAFNVSGVADVTLADVSCDDFKVDLSGVGNIYLTGSIQKGRYNVSGVGHVYAFDCPVENLRCDVSGVGGMEVNAVQSLEANASGVGNIKYKGNPEDLRKSASGVGKIKQAD